MNEFIEKAVDVAGSQTSLARAIGCTSVFVHEMLHGKKKVSSRLCIPIENAVNGAVTRYDLRPDVFGEDPGKAKRKGRAA